MSDLLTDNLKARDASASKNLENKNINQTEFTCKSGDCVPLESRCDLNLDCEDATDELDCGILDK